MENSPQNITDTTEQLPGFFTCGSRARQYMLTPPVVEDHDFWRQHENKDRVCSYCGSLHPDDFIALVKAAAVEGSEVDVEPSDKMYKVYVNRPSVRNAMHGGIKFYCWHLDGLFDVDENRSTYDQAVRKSAARIQERYGRVL